MHDLPLGLEGSHGERQERGGCLSEEKDNFAAGFLAPHWQHGWQWHLHLPKGSTAKLRQRGFLPGCLVCLWAPLNVWCLELCRAWNKNHQVWRTLYLHFGDTRASAKFLIPVGRVFCYQACQQCCGFFGVWTLHAGAIFCPLCSPCPCCEACISPGVLVVSPPDMVLTLNSWSVTWSARLQTALSIIKLLALALIIVPGMMLLAQGHTENFQDAFDRQSLVLDKLPLAFYAGMFAYSGWFQTSFVREELVRPERNIPLAVIVSVITVIVGYMLTNISYYTVLGTQDVLASPAVAVSFVQRAFKSLISVVPVLVALSCFGTMNGGIFTFSRTLFVASREGQWPPLFSMIHIRRHTPLPAVMLMFPLVTAMVCIGDIYHLMNFFSFSRWLFIGLATLGLIVHRHRHPELHSPFKVPLFVPISFTIICLFTVAMSFYSDPVNISIGCTVVLSGFPVYYLIIHRQMSSRCRSPFYYLTHKLQLLLEVVQQEIKTY
ncbi:cystine/glutamate transporter-like isoform X1 [Falco biarmicus]|uniref:cystine/glutamate transporter-like isoform X1 n=1 Tax=Falco cherrug TaxID=345164 RepID=UPI000FFC64BE|nr:cystine/glutamate transporter-like isoform X1 [Falco cherrug]XP_037243704.1 cystine/glutamate transporter-like isoform X1 [Falco rusticolus]XP_037243705.1 cystine/glutamate transporter-like isoform X1 [Falco rusticolus]XP_055567789.1 cystine/glutamate transporter-like isoform X1 [Falco cherrug]XP_055664262.1 cystine/glutamate transporter-like isoform X1 [Falco peregrinus]XP_056196641.1 cystine/glutamate transporter-like isoform X1 [Falco biarmicus]